MVYGVVLMVRRLIVIRVIRSSYFVCSVSLDRGLETGAGV